MTKETKRKLILLGIIVAVVVFFLAKGWVTKDDLLDVAQQALIGESASQSEVVLPEFEASLPETSASQGSSASASPGELDEDGSYNTKDEVALYLHTYGRLPDNYLTKNEAQDRGWVSNKGNLDDVAPGMSIGGDRFSNREGRLPTVDGRKWYECDINYEGGYRGAERILFSSDGLIFYTDDHYETFTQLY